MYFQKLTIRQFIYLNYFSDQNSKTKYFPKNENSKILNKKNNSKSVLTINLDAFNLNLNQVSTLCVLNTFYQTSYVFQLTTF